VKQLAAAFAKEHAFPQEPQLETVVFVFVSQPFATLESQLPKPGEQVREHVPAEQVGVALVVEHAAPQPPQCPTVVFVFVSQPLFWLPSQLPKPVVQVPSVHVPVEQDSAALARSHTTPHAPQFELVRMFVSQPLFGLPSQLAKPAAHVGTQAPAVQVVVPFALLQVVPHAPQFDVLVDRFASQPFDAWPSQLPKPVLHVPRTHPPPEQAAPAFANEHALPQLPQSVTEVFVLVSHPFDAMPSQLPNPAVQVGTQAPVVQTVVPWAFVQALLQAPQSERLVLVFVSQPFAGLLSQLPKPALHVPSVQVPATQLSDAFARLQATPHPPQSDRVLMFLSQPFPGLPSQLAKPEEHTGAHAPDTHDVVPLAFEHPAPQAPQLVVVLSAASHPLPARPSQLPKPAVQVNEHALPLHDDVAFGALHAVPQAPQLPTLVAVFVSQPFVGFPSQSRKVPLHTGVHVPPTQLVVPLGFVQPMPQTPQLLALVLVLVSQPFAGLLSQLPKPALQTGAQAPPEQLVVPLALVHGWPQPPQLLALVLVLASQPFDGLLSQLANPALQVGMQEPAVQTVVPFAFVHELPQVPQFARVVFRLVSQPVEASPSQLPKPELQAMEHAPSEQLGVPLVPLQDVPHAPQFATVVSVFVSHPVEPMPSQLPNPAAHVPSVHVPETHDSVAFAKLQT
jgi:hypothetical protein